MNHNFFLVSAIIFITSCQSYTPERIDMLSMPGQIHIEKPIPETKQSIAKQEVGQKKIDLPVLVEWLGANNPRIKEARIEYRNAHRQSQIKTPWPNPEIQIGLLIGAELNGATERRLQPNIAIGIGVPLGGRLKAQDNVYTAQAKLAYTKLLYKYRSEYLQLRTFYFQLLLMQKQYDVQSKISKSLEKSVATSKKLVEAGGATGLDVSIMEIELQQSKNEQLQLQTEILKIAANLFAIVGMDVHALKKLEAPKIPELKAIPSIKELRKIMLKNNPDIVSLYGSYEVAEKELELEVAKQYPDIKLQSSFQGDPGEDTKIWGVSVEIPLPIFDRNQQAIAASKGNRNSIQNQRQNTLQNKKIDLQKAYETYILTQKRFSLLRDTVLSKAEENIKLTEIAVRSGNVDFLRYLEVQRTSQRIKLNSVQAEIDMYAAWLEIEKVIGMPIILFDAEQNIQDLSQQERE
ncbi:TolC family protein [Candidatus Uabimicrobium sp. HlEnr_7]|uniref:TolC family protein n=1 Tax=Candidatus Uabimicrobium helgolandensis TaxID=3095367 RepID=UPI003556D12F